MADPTHLLIVANGQAAVRKWSVEHRNERLQLNDHPFNNIDFSGRQLARANFQNSDLTGANFTDADISGAIFTGATLDGANFQRCNLNRAKLNNASLVDANLTNASCKDANFEQAKLDGATLQETNLQAAKLDAASVTGVSFKSARIVEARLTNLNLASADLGGQDCTRTIFDNSNLHGANFSSAGLSKASFSYSNLLDVNFARVNADDSNFFSASANGADFSGARLRNANLEAAVCKLANFTRANVREAIVDKADFELAKGLSHSVNIVTVRVSSQAVDVRYFDSVVVPWPESILGWEQIRFLGRLPLFAASYSALIAIPFLYYFLDMYNRKVDTLRAWARNEINSNGPFTAFAITVVDHFHREPVPKLSLLLLLSTIALGIGATIFALACPARIRQYNRDQWRDELRQSLIHYLPFSWRYRWLRLLCIVFYVVGSAGILVVLASKLWNVFWFIIGN